MVPQPGQPQRNHAVTRASAAATLATKNSTADDLSIDRAK